jgi:hypothetical protein
VKIDQEQIKRGEKIHRVLTSEDAAPILAELEARIKDAQDKRSLWHPGNASESALAFHEAQQRALVDFRDWMFFEVEEGASELQRKNEAEG